MQVNNIQQNAVYGVQPRPEADNKTDGLVPEEEKEVPRKRDEYVPSDEDEDIGLYEPPKEEREKSESCTCDTDRVDGEIKRLREKQEQLEQKLRAAEGENAERIRKQLESVSAELAMKDNDAYRRQNAIFS
ncbi:MAG: hypothetical protein K2G04_06155 [Oscillospiraceae bacterium]|nr:hypothetical protein [Oscillospiraceae bacterium]